MLGVLLLRAANQHNRSQQSDISFMIYDLRLFFKFVAAWQIINHKS